MGIRWEGGYSNNDNLIKLIFYLLLYYWRKPHNRDHLKRSPRPPPQKFSATVVYPAVVGYQVRPKARGLAQHGGPPGWLEESNPSGVILYVMDGLYACLFRTVPVAQPGAAQLQADGISSCRYIVNVHHYPSWATTHARKASMAWYSCRPMPSLWFTHDSPDYVGWSASCPLHPGDLTAALPTQGT